ncbi:organic solute transporter Ostalpha-domain-containing protein [Paraphoma chrysanthemicola]|uniref:Organic solute transporter Ostalpha-domain-containing protein n=1 Tax=Paraphoma chrysanthemicola TaxID=798071 RepID=A0A8K0QZ88_9PLEO|nr:organic solute transporter Ostalpha-domain-containing protein [Paraphoma chrysanthemicola]
MMPIYAIVSFSSLVFHRQDVYLELIRNCYEAFVIASFFTLMCHYVAPTLHQQKEYFRNVQPKPWIFPLNGVKVPRSGLTWFNIIYVGINQFCITRPLFALIAIVTESQGRYCGSSTRPENGSLWITLLQGACVLVAMYCVVQFYMQLKEDLASHEPALKVLCIKLVMFLVFWQTWLLGMLSRKKGPLQPTARLASLDIRVGIPSVLICFEMTLFAILHHWAFPWRPYDLDRQLRGPDRPEAYARSPFGAFLDALNPWDYAKAAARGLRWLFHGVHHRMNDSSYHAKPALPQKTAVDTESKASMPKVRNGTRSDPGPRDETKRRLYDSEHRGLRTVSG